MKPGQKTDTSVLNGFRVLSISWIVYGHAFSFILNSPIKNIQTVFDELKQTKLTYVLFPALYGVDSFFFLSGFLMFYLVTEKLYKKRKNGMGMYIMIYFHRYYRLFFPLVGVILFAIYIFP